MELEVGPVIKVIGPLSAAACPFSPSWVAASLVSRWLGWRPCPIMRKVWRWCFPVPSPLSPLVEWG